MQYILDKQNKEFLSYLSKIKKRRVKYFIISKNNILILLLNIYCFINKIK